MPRKVRVLVVDDAPARRQCLERILKSDSMIELVDTAVQDMTTLELLERHRPDVVAMDIALVQGCAFELTRRIMEVQPLPVVIVSAAWDRDEVATTFRAVEAGAVAVVGKPLGPAQPNYDSIIEKLLQTIKAMSEVRVVRRRPRTSSIASAPQAPAEKPTSGREVSVIAIGASTGGPVVIQSILGRLSRMISAPVLIVQHIAPGFVTGLADWLEQTTGFPTHVGQDAQIAAPGHAYLAPDGFHMGICADGRLSLSREPEPNGPRPSVSHLFTSVNSSFGAKAIGVLLSGMGRDGARELELMKRSGALTLIQDRETSVIFGMPGEALKLDAASHVLTPDGIAAVLESTVGRGRGRPSRSFG